MWAATHPILPACAGKFSPYPSLFWKRKFSAGRLASSGFSGRTCKKAGRGQPELQLSLPGLLPGAGAQEETRTPDSSVTGGFLPRGKRRFHCGFGTPSLLSSISISCLTLKTLPFVLHSLSQRLPILAAQALKSVLLGMEQSEGCSLMAPCRGRALVGTGS